MTVEQQMDELMLPPLPKPEYPAVRLGINRDKLAYTVDQMREYAKKAVEAEREACAKVCEDDFGNGALNLADALRARR